MLLNVEVFAQTDSLTVHQINGKDYYIHIVEAGNTLYGISKLYDTPVDVIKKENPSVLDGLSLGEKIFIPLKKNDATVNSINGNFILHTVEKGRTLYSLAKEYGVPQKDIMAINPEIEDEGIKEGQVIKIPIKEIKLENNPNLELPKETNKYKTHLVKQGETLYSLSKLYQVSIDSIQLVNNGLSEGLKLGETINIPILEKRMSNTGFIKNTLIHSVVDTLNIELQVLDTISKKNSYKISLLLPFYVEENEEIAEKSSVLDEKKIYPKSRFAVEFYQGMVLALDSLSNEKVKFELSVYDTKGQDSLAIVKLLQKPELAESDLIVGPLYFSNFEMVADYANHQQIPIVSPVKQNNKILLGNPFVYKIVPSKLSLVDNLTKLAIDSFSNANLIAVEHQYSKENQLAEHFAKQYNQLIINKQDTFLYSTVKKISISRADELIPQLKKNMNNVFFVPSTNSTFVTNLFSSLSNVLHTNNYKDYQITLIGLEEWASFENIDLVYFDLLNVHIPVQQYINYNDEVAQNVISKYYQLTETYPTNTSFLGYDVGIYFGNQLITKGSTFYMFQPEVTNGISFGLNFYKTGVESGFENTNTSIINYQNLVLKKVY
ncbi:MAG: LysM peptidoglycan-binding domain-containing protein [Flavobacteriales bacterium]|nr:LysM peptidoglycan-binding domain-containing protein [Flavobacteriales bacterium]